MSRKAEEKRLVLLWQYCRELLQAGIPRLLVIQAHGVWQRGVKTVRDAQILDRLDAYMYAQGV